MIRIQFNIAELNRRLNQMQSANTESLMREIEGYMQESVDQAFVDEKDPETGKKWKPVLDNYRRWKAKHNYSSKILQLSGELAMSVSGWHNATKAVVGSNLKYAARHNFGYDETGLHQRRFAGLDETARENIQEAVSSFFASQLSE